MVKTMETILIVVIAVIGAVVAGAIINPPRADARLSRGLRAGLGFGEIRCGG